MPGSSFGNSIRRGFLTKEDIMGHIKKAINNNNRDRLKYYLSLIDDIHGKYINFSFEQEPEIDFNLLDYAALKGSLDCFELLRENNIEPTIDTLIYACESGSSSIVRELVTISKIDVNTKGSKGLTPLMILILGWASNKEKKTELFTDLIKYGADVNIIYTGENNMVPRYTITTGSSILMMACHVFRFLQKFFPPIIKEIVAKGANIDLVNSKGQTALHCACRQLNDKAVEILVEAGANVNIQDNNGLTPLIDLTYEYNYIFSFADSGLNIINILMKSRPAPLESVNLDLQDNNGNTALMISIQHNKAISKLLIDSGANVGLVNKQGRDALSLASKPNKILLDKENNYNERTSFAEPRIRPLRPDTPLPPAVKNSIGGRIRTRKNKHRVTRGNKKYKSTRIKRK